ncbi:MAG: SdrD B-like domain-containing protein, partial [Saprospiraceae bacterium]
MKLTFSDLLRKALCPVIFNILIITALHSQSSASCAISASLEPDRTSQVTAANAVREIVSPTFSKWNNLQNNKFADQLKSTVILTSTMRSREIVGNQLKLNIPKGSIIEGITLMIKGTSSAPTKIDEVEILLTGMDGEPKGANKKNTAKLQNPWSSRTDGTDGIWMYGSATDTWGANWTADELNTDMFGYQLQIRNVDNGSINVAIDQITIIVHYIPVFTFCNEKCLTFYTDKYENFSAYRWYVPNGFESVSPSLTGQTIDLKITSASFGMHQICVDVYDANRQFVKKCCRDILYQDCSNTEIKGQAWLDYDDDKLRSSNEGKLAGIPIILFTPTGVPVETVMTDLLGNYYFSNILLGDYYIQGPIYEDKSVVLFTPINADLNSDFTNVFGPATTSVFTTQVGRCLENIDLGYTPIIAIGDFAWHDINYNGVQDSSEVGIAGLKVILLKGEGIKVDSVLTDSLGFFKFRNLPANKYALCFDVSTDYKPTFRNPLFDQSNSKIDSTGKTPVYNFITSGSKSNMDAGYYIPAKIGDLVWED